MEGKGMAELVKITKLPSFFKVLVMEDFSTQLQIPRAFVKTFGELIVSKQFQLQTDSDQFWKVDVANANERLYFQKGWGAFVKDNLLEYGDFIVFKYVGNSTFKVNMYGSHCCEKKVHHSMIRDHIHIQNNAGLNFLSTHNQEKRKTVVEDVEDVVEMMKHNKSRSLGNLIPKERMKGSADKEIHTASREIIYIDNEIDECKGSVKKQRTNAHIEENTAIALEEAKRFKSNCPSFHVVLSHTNANFCMSFSSNNSYAKFALKTSLNVIVDALTLYLPSRFYRTHMKKEKIVKQNVKLETCGRLWTVALINNGYGQPNYAKLSAGWRVFCKDNKLKPGDVCVFEMRKRKNVLFKVHIFRC